MVFRRSSLMDSGGLDRFKFFPRYALKASLWAERQVSSFWFLVCG